VKSVSFADDHGNCNPERASENHEFCMIHLKTWYEDKYEENKGNAH